MKIMNWNGKDISEQFGLSRERAASSVPTAATRSKGPRQRNVRVDTSRNEIREFSPGPRIVASIPLTPTPTTPPSPSGDVVPKHRLSGSHPP